MRNNQHRQIATDRDNIENDECSPMSPMVDNDSAGISVDRAKQSAQRIIEADHKHCCADDLQVLRHKTHPKFFACADDENRDEQNDQIALESEKSGQRLQRRHSRVLSDQGALFKFCMNWKVRRSIT